MFRSAALVARAAEARDVVPDGLRARGVEVDVVDLYETVAESPEPRQLERALSARLSDLHLVLDGPPPAIRVRFRERISPATRLGRSAPSRARRCGRPASSPMWRRPAMTSDGLIEAATRGRDRPLGCDVNEHRPAGHVPVRLRPRERVRRRLPCGDRPPLPGGPGINLTMRSRVTTFTRAPSCCGRRCPSADAIILAVVDPACGHDRGPRPAGDRRPNRRAGAAAGRARQRDLLMPSANGSAGWPRRLTWGARPSAAAGLAHLPRPRHLRSGRRRAGRRAEPLARSASSWPSRGCDASSFPVAVTDDDGLAEPHVLHRTPSAT